MMQAEMLLPSQTERIVGARSILILYELEQPRV